MTLNLTNIKTEIENSIRSADILTITQRGVTTSTDTGTFSSADTHTLGTNPTLVKNVRSVTRGTLLTYGEDYTVNFVTGVISFTTTQDGSYTIIYDQGSGDSIYTDFPRDDLNISSYPRIAIDFSGIPTDAFGIGGTDLISSPRIAMVIYADNVNNIDAYTQSIKDHMKTNAKSFFYLRYIKLTFIGPIIESPGRSAEIMHRNLDYEIMFQTH
ncbi:hypothetical protein LCGC14_2018830 [marine sediment metagenome]|uniref:Uncharacterized protein n=1 Tax=marine sediment metagenome TaxID=412755 RepID=A0A0F9EY58_9ZZZZ